MADAKEKTRELSPAAFWKQAGLGYDADFFKKDPPPVDSLKSNASFLKAAELVYKMKTGVSWEQYCEDHDIDRTSKAAKDQLGEFGIDTMRWFNNTTASIADINGGDSSGATFLQLKRANDQQRAAFLYMMHTFEHTQGSVKGLVYGIGQGMTDVINIASIVTTPFTGGLSAGAAQTARAAGSVALKTMLMNSVKSLTVKGLALSAAEGAVGSAAQNTIEQNIQSQKFKLDTGTYQYQHGFKVYEFAKSVGLGVAFGAGLGATGQIVGDTLSWTARKAFSNWSSTANVTTPAGGASQPTPNAGAAAGNAASAAASTGVSRSGIALPEFNPTTDIMKFWARRNWNPLKLFTTWAPVTNMVVESRPIMRPVIKAVDDFMNQKGLITGIKKLQDDVLTDVAQGGNGRTALDNFINDQAITRNIDSFVAGVKDLREHFKDKYKVIASETPTGFFEKRLGAGARKGDWELTRAIPGMAGEYGKYGITQKQKTAMLTYLDDMIDMASTLQKADGNHIQQIEKNILKIQNGEDLTYMVASGMSVEGITEKATAELFQKKFYNGMSKAFEIANDAKSRLDKISFNPPSEPGKRNVSVQWDGRLERSIQEGHYNPHQQQEFLGYTLSSGPENAERTWQNWILEYAQKTNIITLDEKGYIKHISWTDQNVPGFITKLEELHNAGFGHEVLYALDDLMRRRHSRQGSGGDLDTVPSMIKDFLRKKPKYSEFLADGKTPNPEYDSKYRSWATGIIAKIEAGAHESGAQLELFPWLRVNRQNRHHYASETYAWRMTGRHRNVPNPLRLYMSLPGFNYYKKKYFDIPKQYTWDYLRGAQSFTYVDEFAKTNSWDNTLTTNWRAEGETRAANFRRSFARIASGGLIDDLHWNPFRMPSSYAYKVQLPFLIGGLAYTGWRDDELTLENTWNQREDYTSYQLLQLSAIPLKTVWGGMKGFWNAEGVWDNDSFRDGAVNAALATGGGIVDGFWHDGLGDVWNTTLGGADMSVRRFASSFGSSATTPGGDKPETTPAGTAPKLNTKKKDKDDEKSKAEDGKKSAEQLEKEKAEEELRQKLRRFGQTVAGLNNSIAYDGKWNKDRIEAFEELKTERAEIEEQMKAHVLGDHAQAIFKEASETLDGQLRGNIEQKGRPVRVPTFQEQENIRKHATSTKLIKWHDDVRLLKNDVAQAGGFDEGRRNRLTALTGEHAKFEKDVAFLGQDMKDADKRATNWMTSLTAASKATVPGLGSVVPADAPPINTDAEKQRLEALEKTQQEKEAKEKTDREKAEADQRAKEALQNSGQNKPASGGGDSSTVTPPSNPQVQTTTPPPQTPGQQVKPPQQTVTPAPSGPEKGLGESLGDLWRATTDYTKLEGEDGAGGNALGNAFGAAVSGGWNWLSNTYTHVKNKPGGSGRGWIRDGGAAIGALIASSTVISPFWDKIWVGQIPIVGTILKLGSLFIAFMFFRKGLDTFMDPAPPLAPSTGVAQSDSIAQRRQSYLPRVEGDGYVTHVQSSAGGTPQKRVIFSDRDNVDPLLDEISIHMKDGKPVMQLVTDKRHTFVSGGEINETALQSIGEGRRHFIPRDRMPLNSGGLKDMMAEAIPHQRTPGKAEDSIYVTFQDLGTYQFTPKPELNEPTLAR